MVFVGTFIVNSQSNNPTEGVDMGLSVCACLCEVKKTIRIYFVMYFGEESY